VLASGERTWTVLGADRLPLAPVEDFLESLRVTGRSPNTVKAYARGLELFWRYLALCDRPWKSVRAGDLAGFLGWLRTGEPPRVVALRPAPPRLSESTIALRLAAVLSFYRYQHFNGVDAAAGLYEAVARHGRGYRPFLEHVARRQLAARPVIRVERARRSTPPILTPTQIELIKDTCARFDGERREWVGVLRDRLLWTLLAESGLRVGEALGLQHRDWHTGRGDTPWIEIVVRDHPHGARAKSGYRRLYISDDLDRLYGDYLWLLLEQGADLDAVDFDATYLLVNVSREPRFAPMRSGTVDYLVRRLRRQLAGQVPADWTAHWFRHTHATAMLLSGVPPHVVSRRLGHGDVQTTLNLYAWVTEDAELRAVADWRAITERWRVDHAA